MLPTDSVNHILETMPLSMHYLHLSQNFPHSIFGKTVYTKLTEMDLELQRIALPIWWEVATLWPNVTTFRPHGAQLSEYLDSELAACT